MRNRSAIFKLVIGLFILLVAWSALVWAEDGALFFQPEAIRVLIFTGRHNHDWRSTTLFLKQLLLDSGRFDVRVTEEPAGTTAATLAPYDLLVLNYNGPRWGDVTEKAVTEFVQSGKGLVAVHCASYAFSGLEVLAERNRPTGIFEPAWPEYNRLIGGTWSPVPPKTGHGDRHAFRVRFVNSDHPIARDMGGSFVVVDQLFHNMNMHPDVNVLATAYSKPEYEGTGEDEPMLWTSGYGRGRVFHTALGHDDVTMHDPGFVSTFVRGCEWAATGTVTLPPMSATPAREMQAVKALVVTGGHEYETPFYRLFEGHGDLTWSHAASAAEALRNKIREKYDVLVLYDMTQEDIGEKARNNLRDFVEGGKGVVVLHHAILNRGYGDWWWQDVVGGMYLREPAMGIAEASTYKHDEELFVRPVISHPITDEIGPFHLWDETYKSMWISPDVKVLLETDNPTSDGPVAWISPYEKSRVVYIQLGHDHHAHLHPGYKKLVHRAILWTAGRLD